MAYVALTLVTMVAVSSYVEHIVRQKTIDELTVASQNICDMVQATLKSAIENSLRAHAEDALQILESYRKRAAEGEFDETEARRRAQRFLVSLKFGKTGYYYGLDASGTLLFHPQTEFVGQRLLLYPFIREQISRREGYLEYLWRNPDEDREHPKALFMVYDSAWNWIVSATSYRRDFIHLIRKDFFREGLLRIQHGHSGYSAIFDINGNVIIHPFFEGKNMKEAADEASRQIFEAICKKKNGQLIYSWVNPGELARREKIAIFKYLPEFGWIVLSTYYLDEVMTSLSTLRHAIVIITLLSLLAVFALNYGIGSFIASPINGLVESAKTISAGDLEHRATPARIEELGLLADSFNTMTGKLHSTMATLSRIVEAMPSGLVTLTADGNVVQWNRAAGEMTGISSATGASFWELFPALEKYRHDFDRMIADGEPVEMLCERIELGSARYVNLFLFPIELDYKRGGVIRLDDVTEATVREQSLRQIQKMDTIGNLAGGIAHDFNNALSGIVGTVSLLNYMLETENIQPDKLKQYLGIIESSGRKATNLVQQLLSLARKSEIILVPTDLRLIIKGLVTICANAFDRCVEVQVRPMAEPALVRGDPNQLEQVLLNLAINGYHSMTLMRPPGERQGGRLSIGIERVNVDETYCRLHPDAHCGPYWTVSVQDQGVGIDPVTQARMFEPFFTTKAQHQGTGLGLSMAYSIIHQHGGFIKIYSEIGIGSNFIVHIPVYAGASGEGAEKPKPVIPRGSGLVLVIDDESTVRETARAMLKSCGYDVLVPDGPLDALEVFAARHSEISVVLLDVIMPKLSGREVFERLHAIDPNVRVLLASGYTQDERVDDLLAMGIREFIQKPFTFESLAMAISRVMT